MSSVSVFAFIDKQGIMTENQKYVDEIVVFNEKEEKEVLDLMHKDNDSPQQNEVYQAEGNSEEFIKKAS